MRIKTYTHAIYSLPNITQRLIVPYKSNEKNQDQIKNSMPKPSSTMPHLWKEKNILFRIIIAFT
jgi:hypothetical protein